MSGQPMFAPSPSLLFAHSAHQFHLPFICYSPHPPVPMVLLQMFFHLFLFSATFIFIFAVSTVSSQKTVAAAVEEQKNSVAAIFPPLPWDIFQAGIASGARAVAPKPNCRLGHLQHCQQMFAMAIGERPSIMTEPKQLTVALRKWYHKRNIQDGLGALCSNWANFYRCLGTTYDSCTDPFELYNVYKDEKSPSALDKWFQLSGVLKELSFDCLGGNVQVDNHLACLQDTWARPAYQKGREDCIQKFQEEIAHKKDFCVAAQHFINCAARLHLNRPFTECPDKDLAWWGCERFRVGFSIDGFCPSLECNKVLKGKEVERNTAESKGNAEKGNSAGPGIMAAVGERRTRLYGIVGKALNRQPRK